MNENRRIPPTSIASSDRKAWDEGEIDILTLLALLWRGKWMILGMTFVFVLAGAVYATQIATPMYPATAELALKAQQEQIITNIESVLSGNSASSETINTEIDVMTSRKLIGRLVEQLGLLEDPEFNATLRQPPPLSPGALVELLSGGEDDPPPTREEIRNKVIDEVGDALSVTNRANSLTFVVSALSEDPQKSVRLANTLARLYIDNQLQEKFDANERASEFLSSRAAELRQELQTAESELNRFRDQAELVSPDQLSSQTAQLKGIRDRVESLALDIEIARPRLDQMNAHLADGDWAALAELTEDQALARALAANDAGGADDIDVARVAERAVGLAEAQLSRQEAQLSGLRDMAERMGSELDRQSEELIRLQQLEREAEATRLLYESFLSRLKETNIQRGLAQADARMLSEAVPRPASRPQVPFILALSGIFGMLTGAGIVYGREATHTGLRTTEELATASGHVVLGTIPMVPVRGRADVIRHQREKPSSVLAEAVRNLRTSILLSDIDSPPKVLMLTSAVPGEGKTTLALSLAQNMAALGQRILLIEGDIRRRTFGQYLDAGVATGLLDAIEDHGVLERGELEVPELGVDILVGTEARINAADLFSSRKFREFMSVARDRYDQIIIDTPPVLVVPDARVIGQEAEAIIVAVRWDSTSRAQVREALEMLQSVGLKITGLVMTQVDSHRMKRYGHAGQYGYYGDRSKYYDS